MVDKRPEMQKKIESVKNDMVGYRMTSCTLEKHGIVTQSMKTRMHRVYIITKQMGI